MKRLLSIVILSGFISVFAQGKRDLYLKGNMLFVPVGMVNLGLEYRLSHRYTFQTDVFVSLWKSMFGRHSQIYMGHLEGRYYMDKAFCKWYIGVNVGAGVYDLTKWNYKPNNQYQRGFNYMFGGTAGYQFQWKKRWNIDVFAGVGSVQSFYHGYEKIPVRRRYDSATHWNKSGEFIPYRGGIMISYKLR